MKVKGVELGNECLICGSKENLEIHHIVPISKGGTNEIENLAILCRKCNREIRNTILPIIEEQFKILQFGGDGTRENLQPNEGLTVKISGDTLQQVMTVRGDREKVTGRITPIAELVREAIRFWYKRKEKE